LIRAALALTAALGVWAGAAGAVECSDITYLDAAFTICTVDPAREDLRLFLRGADGQPYEEFTAVERATGPLAFAMNAGMYHPDRRPVGLYVEDGIAETPLLTADSADNFGLLPNGVLCIGDGWARVVETLAFAAAPPDCRYASQSGPMLVIDGALHPRFLPDSTFRNIRNGVGAGGGRVVFAISNQPVTFYQFALLFRDGLALGNALYFDGSISRLYAPGLGRADWGAAMGPIVGIVAQ